MVAFAAGYATWLASGRTDDDPTRRGSSRRASPPSVPSPSVELEADRLQARLALYRSIPQLDLVIHGVEPLARKLRRIADLPAAEQGPILHALGGRVVYSRDAAKEVLDLIRQEQEPEILLRLADLIRQGCVTKLTMDPTFTRQEKRDLFIVARSAVLPERRIAVVEVIGGDRAKALPADVEEVIVDVLRLDPEPAVVRAAAGVVERHFGANTTPALLVAYRRLPEGPARRRVATAYARWAGWKALREQLRRTTAPSPQYDDWAHALSVWFPVVIGGESAWENDFVRVYRNAHAREIRRALFRALAARSPTPLPLMRRVAPMEPDADLRSRYGRILAAADPDGSDSPREVDWDEILGD